VCLRTHRADESTALLYDMSGCSVPTCVKLFRSNLQLTSDHPPAGQYALISVNNPDDTVAQRPLLREGIRQLRSDLASRHRAGCMCV